MGYIWAKDEGNKFFKHVPHFCYSTRSSGTFSLNVRRFYPSMNFQFSHCNLCVSQTSIKNSIFLPRTSSARWFLINAVQSIVHGQHCFSIYLQTPRLSTLIALSKVISNLLYVMLQDLLQSIYPSENQVPINAYENSIVIPCIVRIINDRKLTYSYVWIHHE